MYIIENQSTKMKKLCPVSVPVYLQKFSQPIDNQYIARVQVVDRGFNKPYFPQKYHLIFNDIQIRKFVKNHLFVPYLSRDGSG